MINVTGSLHNDIMTYFYYVTCFPLFGSCAISHDLVEPEKNISFRSVKSARSKITNIDKCDA